MAVASDGQTIASGGHDYLKLWDVASGMTIGEPFRGHSGLVTAVTFTPDGRTLVSGSEDCTVRLWDTETGQIKGTPLVGHTASVRCVAVTPDGGVLASGSEDGTIRLWDMQKGNEARQLLHVGTVHVDSVAFCPDGALVCGCEDGSVWRWSPKTGLLVGVPLKGHSGKDWPALVSCDETSVVERFKLGSAGSIIRLWDAQTGEQIGAPLVELPDGTGPVALGSKHIASGYQGNNIILRDARTGNRIGKPFEAHIDHLTALTFTPDGSTIISGSLDNTVRAWDVESKGEHVADEGKPMDGHLSLVASVAFSLDGKYVASSSMDGVVIVWSAETGSMTDTSSLRQTAYDKRNAFAAGRVLRGDASDWRWSKKRYVPGADRARSSLLSPSVMAAEAPEASDQGVEELNWDREGWIRRDGRKWLWLPESYGRLPYEDAAHCYLHGSTLVIPRPDVHILDVAVLL